MRARTVSMWVALVLVWATDVGASAAGESQPAHVFSTPTPTPVASRLLSPQEEHLVRQLENLFERGARAASEGRLALAYSCFKQVLSASSPASGLSEDSPIASYREYAARAIETINTRGDEILRLAQRHQMEKRYLEAVELYEVLVGEFRFGAVGRVAHEQLRRLLDDPECGPQILLKRARECEQRGDLWRAWEFLSDLVARYPGSPQAGRATARIDEMQRSGLFVISLPPQEAREARKLLMIADIRRLNRHVSLKLEPAEELYRAVISRYPGTPYAAEAERKLQELEDNR